MTVITSPAQARTLARLHETILYPTIWPDGSQRSVHDIAADSIPYTRVEDHSDTHLVVTLYPAVLSASKTVYVDPAGRVLAWDEDTNTFYPVTVQWRQDPRWPSAMWTLTLEQAWPSWVKDPDKARLVTYPRMLNAEHDHYETRQGVMWSMFTMGLEFDQCIVRDLIDGTSHTVKWRNDLGWVRGACPMCGSTASLSMAVEYEIPCPNHYGPLDEDPGVRMGTVDR
jgi:hypothetical protein